MMNYYYAFMVQYSQNWVETLLVLSQQPIFKIYNSHFDGGFTLFKIQAGKLIFIIIIQKSNNLMPNWKQLINRSQSKASLHSRKSENKFVPRKQDDQNSGTMFRNMSISRIQQSFIDSEMHRSRSISKSILDSQDNIPKKMTSSVSREKMNRLKSIKTLDLPGFQPKKQIQVQKSFGQPNASHHQLVHELQNLKKQFRIFQQKILGEIKRQEQMLVKMFEEVLNNISNQETLKENEVGPMGEAKENSMKPLILNINSDSSIKKSSELLSKFENQDKLKMPSLKLSTDTSRKGQQLNRSNVLKGFQGQRSPPKDSELFRKFFEAMGNLKQQMKEIGNLSELNAIGKTKNQKAKAGDKS